MNMGSALGIPNADRAYGHKDAAHARPGFRLGPPDDAFDDDLDEFNDGFDDFEVTAEKWCFDEDFEACDFDHADWSDVEPEKTERTLHELFEEEDDEDVFRPTYRVVFLSKYL